MKNPYLSYATNQENVSKTSQVIMLYDGIIKHLNRMKKAIELNDNATKSEAIDKACKIILGLQAALDWDKGGNMAKILNDFYNSIYPRISLLTIEPNINNIDNIIEEIKPLRDIWKEVDIKMNKNEIESDFKHETHG